MEDTMTRSGRIMVNGDPRPFSTWEVEGKYVYNKTGSSWSYCTAYDRKTNKQTPYSTTHRNEIDKTGTQPANIGLNIGEPENNRVSIEFDVPPIKVLNKGNTTNIRQDGCPGGSLNEVVPFNAETVYDASHYTSPTGAPYFKADPEKISGSEIKDGTIKVTYNLYRLRPPVRP